jgi:hypothetical protein
MAMRFGRLAIAGALLASPFLPSACETGGVVGGACNEGFSECAGRCLDTRSDEQNCGACARVCPTGVSCINSVCGGGSGGTSGAAGDASIDSGGVGGSAADASGGVGGSAADASGGVGGSAADASGGVGGSGGDAGGDGSPGDACREPYNTAAACGDCNTRCVPPNRLCAPVGAGFGCVPACTLPLVECGDQCVDLNIDPFNCGFCGNVCPTGLCQGGRCVGANFGHTVLACMNYDESGAQNSPQTVLLGNAVFLPLRNQVRLLTYGQHAPAANRNSVNATITRAGNARGQTLMATAAATPTDVVAQLNVLNFEVFLVYDQPDAPAGLLAGIGTSWNATLDSFTRAGGVVVVLSGGGGRAEMDELITNAGLLPVTNEVDITFAQAFNRSPIDAIGVNVLSPFRTLTRSCTFTTTVTPDASTAFVITDAPADAGLGQPVVVHRIQAP